MNKPKNGEYWIVRIDEDEDLELIQLDYSDYERIGVLWRCGCDIMYNDKKISPKESFAVDVKYIRKVEMK